MNRNILIPASNKQKKDLLAIPQDKQQLNVFRTLHVSRKEAVGDNATHFWYHRVLIVDEKGKTNDSLSDSKY